MNGRRGEGLDQGLAEVWARNLPSFRDRLAQLEDAAGAHARGSDAGREEAVTSAHQLAGSLGSFGLSRGSELAREVEHRLQGGEPPDGDAELVRAIAELRELIEAAAEEQEDRA